MLEVLVNGRLVSGPITRTAKNGNVFVTATMKATTNQSDSMFIDCIAFGDSAETLARLQEGDEVSLMGSGRIRRWSDASGEPRIGFDVLVHRLLALDLEAAEPPEVRERRRPVRRKTAAVPAEPCEEADFDDPLTF